MTSDNGGAWTPISEKLPPRGVVVETKIHDERGLRNIGELKLMDGLWWLPEGTMYVYYTPTHWREAGHAE